MKFKALTGKLKDVNISRLKIDWDSDFGSKFEAQFAAWIYPYWKHDFVVTQFVIPGTKMSLDFFNITKRVAIEVQGRQHQTYVPYLSGSRSGYLGQIKRDLKKAEFCTLNNINLVEILPEDMPLTKDFFKTRYQIDL